MVYNVPTGDTKRSTTNNTKNQKIECIDMQHVNPHHSSTSVHQTVQHAHDEPHLGGHKIAGKNYSTWPNQVVVEGLCVDIVSHYFKVTLACTQ